MGNSQNEKKLKKRVLPYESPYEHPYEFVNFSALSVPFAQFRFKAKKSSTAFEFGAQLNLDFCL